MLTDFQEWWKEYRITHSHGQDDMTTASDAWDAAYKKALNDVGAYLNKQSTECPETDYGRWNIIVELPGIISRLLRGELEEK